MFSSVGDSFHLHLPSLWFSKTTRDIPVMHSFVKHTSLAVGILTIALGASRSVEAATLTHSYNLSNSAADALGGLSLTLNGGTIGTSGYTFAANQGPSLGSNAVNQINYSLLMDFSISDTSGYRKLVDFKDRNSDAGLYNLGGALSFYPVTTGSAGSFIANTLSRLVITRDSATQNFVGYVNGVQQISFVDSGDLATFSFGIAQFLRDDLATAGGEATSGILAKVAIYDGALTSQEVATLGGVAAVPTPALLPGLIGLGAAALRKRKAEKVRAEV